MRVGRTYYIFCRAGKGGFTEYVVCRSIWAVIRACFAFRKIELKEILPIFGNVGTGFANEETNAG